MDIERLQRALVAADAAGDTDAATHLAKTLRGAMASGGAEMSQGDPNAFRLNPAREGTLSARALAGVPITPEGSARALEGLYGAGNVSTSPKGEQFIRDPAAREYYPLDSDRLTMGDVAGLSGSAIEVLPTLAATTVGGAAAGAAVGNLARQGAGALLGERAGMGERAMSTGTAAALAGGSQAMVNAGARVLNALRPSSVTGAIVGRRAYAPAVAASDTVDDVLGIGFTPGQRTQSKALLTMEGMLRRNPASADIIMRNDEAQLGAASKALRSALDRIRPGEVTSESMGNTVKSVFDKTIDRAVQLRRTQAATDFAKVDLASGGAPLIQPNGLRAEIQAIVGELDVPGGGDATAAMVSKLKGMDSQLKGNLSASQYQRLLQIYGSAARGKGKLFQDLDTAQQRWVAGRVSRALEGDLDTAIEQGGLQGDAAASLMTARQNYRTNSQAINDLGKSTLGRMLGDNSVEFDPERLVGKLEMMKPGQLKRAFGMLEVASPDDAQLVKRGLLERVIIRAQAPQEAVMQKLGEGQPIGTGISPARFISELKRSPIGGALSGEERHNIALITQGMQRLANRAGTEGSPTATLLTAMGFAGAIGASVATNDPTTVIGLAAAALATRRLATTMVSAAGQRAWATTLRELSKPRGANARALTGSLMFLAGRPSTEPGAQNVRPDAMLESALSGAGQAGPQPLQGLQQ